MSPYVLWNCSCIDCVCVCVSTMTGVRSEGESPSILCSASQRSAGQADGKGPQPLRSSGGVRRHRAGKRSVSFFQEKESDRLVLRGARYSIYNWFKSPNGIKMIKINNEIRIKRMTFHSVAKRKFKPFHKMIKGKILPRKRHNFSFSAAFFLHVCSFITLKRLNVSQHPLFAAELLSELSECEWCTVSLSLTKLRYHENKTSKWLQHECVSIKLLVYLENQRFSKICAEKTIALHLYHRSVMWFVHHFTRQTAVAE